MVRIPILVIDIILVGVDIIYKSADKYTLLLISTNIAGLSIIKASFKYTNSLAIV